MASADLILPHRLISSADDEAILTLFAETLALAETSVAEVPRSAVMPPGPFWLLAHADLSPEDLLKCWDGTFPKKWPPWFERNRTSLPGNALREAFTHCVENGPRHGVLRGRDLCRLMGAVAQTLYSTNVEIVERNRKLAFARAPGTTPPDAKKRADEHVSAWADENLFVSLRPDEQGGLLVAGELALWMASHVGPSYADKLENQDAVCAVRSGDGLVFALADGVSTSLGSRYAAALAAFRFCHEMRGVERASLPSDVLLVAAAQRTQRAMDKVLDRLLEDPEGAAMREVMRASGFQITTAEAVLENTRTAEKSFLQPAMASTLIGGYLRPGARAGEYVGGVVCVGDGAVEKISEDGTVTQLFSTDAGVLEIVAAMGPGPLSRKALQEKGIPAYEVCLIAGDRLLVSSDGLTRGHEASVWGEVTEMLGDVRPRFRRDSSSAAADLLIDLAAAAEGAQDTQSLFDDNVSMILLAVG